MNSGGIDRSLELLRVMQDRTAEGTTRMTAFEEMMNLGQGWWQHNPSGGPETLLGFARRVAARTIQELIRAGARDGAVDSTDLAQDVLIVFAEKTYQIRTNPRSWLIGVAITLGKAMLRKERHYLRGYRLDDIAELTAVETIARTHSPVVDRQLRLLGDYIRRLPPQDRDIITRRNAGATTAEIAKAVHMSEDAVRQRVSRAIRRLRISADLATSDQPCRRVVPNPPFTVCVRNAGHEPLLERNKIRNVPAESRAGRDGDRRVVDEKGEGHLSADRFGTIGVPARVRASLLAADRD